MNDENEGLSPRITSIAINHYATGQSVSFSTHSIAEELHFSREQVNENFDAIELELLTQFYSFISTRGDKYWVHWNMRNLTYGFEHLDHRYRALGGKITSTINVEKRLNLNDIIVDRYGYNYAKHPKLITLMEMNGGKHRDFLTGAEEVQAFENKEFIRMHRSTLSKVGFFSRVIDKLIKGRLKTSSKGVGIALDRLFESRWAKAVGLLGSIVGMVLGVGSLF